MRGMRLLAATALAGLVAFSAAAEAKETLRLMTVFDAPTVQLWEPVLAAYNEANPDYEVKMETVAGSGAAVYPDVLRTAMASGDPPDVFFMWGGEIAGPFIRAGQVAVLDNYYDKYGWDKVVAPWTIERITRDGHKYGVPFHARGMGLWYRVDLFEKYGLSEPKTYDELAKVCSTFKENGIYCASFGGKFGWQTMRLLDYFIETTCGPEEHDKLNALQSSWNQPCVVAAYDRMAQGVKDGWLVPDFLNVAPNDARMAVYSGDAAMVFEGGWFEGVLKSDEQPMENFKFFLPPTDHTPVRYSAFPEQWMIPEASKHKDAAAALINWLTIADTQKKFPEAFTASATISVESDCSVAPHDCEWKKILTSDSQTYPPTDQAFTKELIDGFFEVQDGVVAGKITPTDAAAQMQAKAEAWKAKQKS